MLSKLLNLWCVCDYPCVIELCMIILCVSLAEFLALCWAEVKSNRWQAKTWTTIDRLLIIWESDLSNKIKRNFFQAAVVSILLYGCTTWTLTKHIEKKLDGNCTRMPQAVQTNPGSNIPQNSNCTATYLPSLKPSKLDKQDMWDTAEEVRTFIRDVFLWTPSHGRASIGQLIRTYRPQLGRDTGCSHVDLPEVLDDRDKWWERECGKSVQTGQHDDDDDFPLACKSDWEVSHDFDRKLNCVFQTAWQGTILSNITDINYLKKTEKWGLILFKKISFYCFNISSYLYWLSSHFMILKECFLNCWFFFCFWKMELWVQWKIRNSINNWVITTLFIDS